MFDQQKLKSIIKFSAVYFHGHSVGGTNPSLLEAMAAGAFVAAHSNPFNKSILRENAVYFTDATEVCAIIDQHENIVNDTFIQNNLAIIQSDFTWDKIVDQYDLFFQECYQAGRESNFLPQPQFAEQLVEAE